MLHIGLVGAGTAVVRLRGGHEPAGLHIKYMHLAILDHVMPSVQADLAQALLKAFG